MTHTARRIGRTLALVLPVVLVLSGTLAVTGSPGRTRPPPRSSPPPPRTSSVPAKPRAAQDVLRDKLLAEIQQGGRRASS